MTSSGCVSVDGKDTSSPASATAYRAVGRALTRVLVEQTGAVHATRIGDYHGHLSAEEQWGVDLALETVLDLQ